MTVPVLTTFSSAACSGVANCATFELSYTIPPSGNVERVRTMPPAGTNAHIFVTPFAGPSGPGTCKGNDGDCDSAHGPNAQPVVFGSTSTVPPRFYWTVPYAAPLPSLCDSVGDFGVSFGADDAYVGGDDFQEQRIVTQGETGVVVVSYDEEIAPLGFVARTSPSARWLPLAAIDSGQSGSTIAQSFRLSWLSDAPLGELEIRCIDANGDSGFYDFGAGTWGRFADENQACAALVITMIPGVVPEGGTVRARYELPAGDYVGGDTLIDVDIGGASIVVGSVIVKSTFGVIIGGSAAPWAGHIPVGSRGVVEWVNVTASAPIFEGDFPLQGEQQNVVCTDSESANYRVFEGGADPWYAGQGTVGGDVIIGYDAAVFFTRPFGEPSVGGCMDSAGIGVNPSSWVPGQGRMITCLFTRLFVPGEFQKSRWDRRLAATSLTEYYAPFDTLTTGLADLATVGAGDCAPSYSMPAPLPTMTLQMCSGPVNVVRLMSWTLSTALIGFWVGRVVLSKMQKTVDAAP